MGDLIFHSNHIRLVYETSDNMYMDFNLKTSTDKIVRIGELLKS